MILKANMGKRYVEIDVCVCVCMGWGQVDKAGDSVIKNLPAM